MAYQGVTRLKEDPDSRGLALAKQRLPKMKTQWKVLACLLVSVPVVAFLLFLNRPARPYPMGGDAEVVDKFVDTEGYHIVIDQVFDWTTEELEESYRKREDNLFSLACTKEQYEMLQVGDIINAYREQYGSTQTGVLKSIDKINGEKVEKPN